MKITHFFIVLLALSLSASSCKDDEMPDPEVPELEVPVVYDFENVSYSGQQSRLAQFGEMKDYIGTSKTQGTALDADRLSAMYANAPGAEYSHEYVKDLRSKTFPGVREDFDNLLIALAADSQSEVPGTEGTAGVIESNDGAKSYLVSAKGMDSAQVFEKSLMGACLYYQATSVYLGDDRMNVDNETITPGEGTDMEHHWDEAFGYFGVPTDFPTNTAGIVFWGNYADKREAVLGNSQTLMDALLKGRAAISADRLDLRDEAIAEVRREWELISVTSALHYLNTGLTRFDDMALRSHDLSEAIGFIYSLQFNEAKRIDNEQVTELLTLIAGSDDFAEMNLYQTTPQNLQSAKNKLAVWYSLEARADEF